MKCNPWRWLWGLIPIVMLSWIAVVGERKHIETDLQSRSEKLLQRSGHGWASIRFEGRDAILTGKALDEAEPVNALSVALDAFGVRVVDNQAGLIEKVERFEWSAIRRNDRIRLDGVVPSDKARRDVLGMVKASFPTLEVDDRTRLARGAPPLDVWLGGVGFGIKQLALLSQGRVDVEQTSLSVSGDAIDGRSFRRVKGALSGRLPQGIRLKNENVRAPLVSPFGWSAVRQGRDVLLSGHVPNDTVRDDLVRIARRIQADAKVIDRMEPASGAPEGFALAAAQLVEQLGLLDDGKAEIRDRKASLVGTTETAAQAAGVQKAVKRGALANYRTHDEIANREPKIKTITPYVTAARIEKRRLSLSGFVPDEAARGVLLAMVRQQFAGWEIADRLELGAGQPEGWSACVDLGLGTIRRLGNGNFALTGRRLAVSGTTEAEAMAQSLPGEVKAKAGSRCDADVQVTLDLAVVKAREEAARRAEEEARRKTEAATLAAQSAAEQQRAEERARDAEARRQAEEASRLAEAEAKRKKVEESQRSAEAAARLKAEEEARKRASVVDVCQKALSRVVREGVINFKRANFDLDASSYPTLNKLAEAANRCPDVVVEIEGHTDAEGTPERNQRLSDRRANAVRTYLTQAGVDASRLTAIGYGATRNIAGNDTAEDRARNRRIEFTVKFKQ